MSHARRLPSLAATLYIAALSSLLPGVTTSGVVSAQTPDIRDLPVGAIATGHLGDSATVDAYRFTLAALERVAVTIDPPVDGAVAVSVADADGQPLAVVAAPPIGAPWAWVGQLGPGAYRVDLRAAPAGTGDYRLRVERLDPFAVSQDQEPNDTPAHARPLPPSLEISGARDADADVDWYSLGTLAAPAVMTLTMGGAPGTVRVSDGTTEYPAVADATGTRLRTVLLPAGLPLYLRVLPDGPYDIRVDSGVPTPSGPPIPAPLFEAEATLTTTPATVAADWPAPQRLAGLFTLQNEERDGKRLDLDALTSDQAWTVSIDQPHVDLGGSAIVSVPILIDVPPFARAGIPVRTTIRALGTDGAQATGFVDITPSIDAPPAIR